MTLPPRRRRGRHIVHAAAALVVAFVLVASVASCATSGASSTGAKGYITGDGSVTMIAPADRKPAPTLAGAALGGGTIDTGDYHGKVIVLNVWGSWCGPCRGEALDLVEAADRLPGAQFVGIDTRQNGESSAEAKAFVRTFDVPYPSLVDQDSALLLKFYGIINPTSIPSTIVIDAQGRIAALVSGPTTASTLVGLVHELGAGA